MIPNSKEFFYVFNEEEHIELGENINPNIPFIRNDIKGRKNSFVKTEIDLIAKKRGLKRWKQSLGYYNLHPEKFKFRLRNLK